MLTVTEQLKQRVASERAAKADAGLMLRLMVDSGGCAGFQYQFTWVPAADVTAEDTVYADALVVDEVSLPFLGGCTVDFVQSLMGEDFKVINPNAVSGCGCGNSFAV